MYFASGRLRELSCLVPRKLWETIFQPSNTSKWAYNKEVERLFIRVCTDRRKSRSFKLEGNRFKLDVRKKFINMRMQPAVEQGDKGPESAQSQVGWDLDQP